ncbi:MAG: hypothetical protein QXX94_07625 [Candidatus Bathyarchaeia archaeon]
MRTYIFTERERKAIKEWAETGRPNNTAIWPAHMIRKHEAGLLLDIRLLILLLKLENKRRIKTGISL